MFVSLYVCVFVHLCSSTCPGLIDALSLTESPAPHWWHCKPERDDAQKEEHKFSDLKRTTLKMLNVCVQKYL